MTSRATHRKAAQRSPSRQHAKSRGGCRKGNSHCLGPPTPPQCPTPSAPPLNTQVVCGVSILPPTNMVPFLSPSSPSSDAPPDRCPPVDPSLSSIATSPPPRAAPSEGSWVMAPIKELLVLDLQQNKKSSSPSSQDQLLGVTSHRVQQCLDLLVFNLQHNRDSCCSSLQKEPSALQWSSWKHLPKVTAT